MQLEVVRCERPQEWTVSIALPSVSFAPLVLPTENETQNVVELSKFMWCLMRRCVHLPCTLLSGISTTNPIHSRSTPFPQGTVSHFNSRLSHAQIV